MNIESANLTPLTPSNVPVESAALSLTDSGAVAEGFSDALVTQLGLLNDLTTGSLLPAQAPGLAISPEAGGGSQSAPGSAVGEAELQDFAALLGNDLPPSYKTKDEVDHEAALAAVTDTLKYIATGTTANDKTMRAEQNMKEVAAMVAEAGQNMTAETERSAAAIAAEVEQNTTAAVAEAGRNTAAVAEAEQNTAAMVAKEQQNNKEAAMDAAVEQDMQNAPVMMPMERDNDAAERRPAEDETRTAGIEGNYETEIAPVAAMILPTAISMGQEKSVNNLTPVDMGEENVWSSAIKPATGDVKQGQLEKAPATVVRSETVFRQPVQDKQGFNLKYFENAGQAEKIGRIEPQVTGLDGEKTLLRTGADIVSLNRSVADHKVDIPAITKPLSHPEWNKDLGERIVWMSSRAIPAAEIRLNPQHLGPISVRVDVTDDQATVVFTAQHATTREAIEASIPKLREMMGAQQLNLSEVNVSQGATSDQGRSQAQNFAQTADGRGRQGSAGVVIDGIDDVEQEVESGRAVVSKGLLSLYA
jgi:flagellar hook-length control protein FliK